jgi:hypothetical protein
VSLQLPGGGLILQVLARESMEDPDGRLERSIGKAARRSSHALGRHQTAVTHSAQQWRPLGKELVMIAGVLAIVAWLAPAPWYETDRGTYETIGSSFVVPDCSSIHCFRPLVAWVVETMPGSSLIAWKLYSVLANAAAGVAVMTFSLALGFTWRASRIAGWISALGFGSQFTLFDPHTSDPLMFFLGPALSTLLVRERFAAAGWLSAVGILAKEFAAAPLWIFALAEAMATRWATAARVLCIAAGVTLAWVVLQLWLMLVFNYSYGDSASADVFGGGYIRLWASYVSPRVAAATIFGEYGALFLLVPWGLVRSGPDLRRLALASVPTIVALAYVQQPDRALWNFHFITIPLAVIVLDRLPSVAVWLFVLCHATANLRLGAQLPFVPSARFALGTSAIIAVAALLMDVRSPRRPANHMQVSTT